MEMERELIEIVRDWVIIIVGAMVIITFFVIVLELWSPKILHSVFYKRATVGEKVTVDDLKWEVFEVENLGDTWTLLETFKSQRGRFVRIAGAVSNQGESLAFISSLEIIDKENKRFRYEATMSGIPSCLRGGYGSEFGLIFDLPQDATNLKLEIDDGPFQGAMIDLGI